MNTPNRSIFTRTAARKANTRGTLRQRAAFTLIELIAVITLILVVLGIAVPAFTNMVRSSERSLAENTLRVGVAVARDLAVLNGRDSGLLFVREENGRTRLIPVVRVGEIRDTLFNPFLTPFDPNNPQAPTINRDIYAPVSFSSTLQMPRGWAVAGYAEPGTIDRALYPDLSDHNYEGWYDSLAYGDEGNVAGDPDPARDAGHWLLPETAYYEEFMQGPGSPDAPGGEFTPVVAAADAERTPRQSFMLRFEGGSGQLVQGAYPALVLDPRPTSLGRGGIPATSRWMRANRIEDAESWTNRVIVSRDVNGDTVVDDADALLRLAAIGNFSNDTVLAGAVSKLAVFEEERLHRGLGVGRPNADTGTIYAPIEAQGTIGFDMNVFPANNPAGIAGDPRQVADALTAWIQGDTNFSGTYADQDTAGGLPADQPVARIFFVQPGTGDLTEVQR